MSNRTFFQTFIILGLSMALLFMSFFFVNYTNSLNANSVSLIVKKATWKTRFKNVLVTDGDFNVKKPVISNSDTVLSFDAFLGVTKAYEFSVDVVNDGDIDAILNSIEFTGRKDGNVFEVSDKLDSYATENLVYSVIYDTDELVTVNDTLNASETKKMIVRVEYICDGDTCKTEDSFYNFTFTLNYIQVNR